MIVSHNITPPVALVRLDDMGKFATNNCPNSTLFVISPSNATAVKLTRCFNKSALIFSCHHLLIYAFYQLQPASQPASQPARLRCDISDICRREKILVRHSARSAGGGPGRCLCWSGTTQASTLQGGEREPFLTTRKIECASDTSEKKDSSGIALAVPTSAPQH